MKRCPIHIVFLFLLLSCLGGRDGQAHQEQDALKVQRHEQKLKAHREQSALKNQKSEQPDRGDQKRTPSVVVVRTSDRPINTLFESAGEAPPEGPTGSSKVAVQKMSGEELALQVAWWHFNKNAYDKAIESFKEALKSERPEIALQAKLGLAYSYAKNNEEDKALELFEQLVEQRYRLNETVSNLIELLIKRREYKKAERYLPLLP